MPWPFRFRRLTTDTVEIQTPTANQHHVIPAGGTSIAGECGSDVIKVWLQVLRLTDPVPAAPPAGWVFATPTSGQFTLDNVPGALTAAFTGDPDNKAVAIPERSNGTYGNPDIVYFIGRPPQENRNVSAQDCIWFAFADPGLAGPPPAGDTEADTANHKPTALVVPANADQMTVQAAGIWRHYPAQNGNDNDASDADGINPLVALERPGYRSGTYMSEMIDDLTALVNTLIGMWVDVDGAPIGSPFVIGVGPTTLPIPATARKLYLAFHDGKRWHNNSGTVAATIDWSQAASFYRMRGR